MRTYHDELAQLKEKYFGRDKSYDEHIGDMQRINEKLSNIKVCKDKEKEPTDTEAASE